jgi:tetratricopeptide (TPR) repeat protein
MQDGLDKESMTNKYIYTMKARITTVFMALLLGFNFGFAQQDEECMNNLSIFNSYVKSKKYDEAYEPWMAVRKKCPKFNRAIYAYGDDILEHKIETSSGAEKVAFIKDLMLLYDQSREHFPSKYALGEVLSDKAELAYTYSKELNMTKEQVYNMFDEAFTKDKANFTSPKGLYTYFSLIVDLYDDGKKSAQEMFDKYDDVIEIIEDITGKYTVQLNKIVEKEEAGQKLSKRDSQIKRRNESVIDAFETKIIPSMDKKLGDRANCEVLVPLYEKDFEKNKENTVWLQRAMNRMFAKGCKEEPLFLRLVEQKNNIQPTADTSYYLYLLTGEQKYFDQTIELETDPLKKSKLYKKLAEDLKSKGSYGTARRYFNEALKLNPSDGSPYLSIAAMYAKSANNCGSDNFSKRAVFWLAASTAEKAGRVDGRLKKTAAQNAASYRASAPTKAEIFQKGNAGQPLKIGCWINITITVPEI